MKRAGVARECSRCWAHPATARLCFCTDEERGMYKQPDDSVACDACKDTGDAKCVKCGGTGELRKVGQ